jgi:hypothetical protein
VEVLDSIREVASIITPMGMVLHQVDMEGHPVEATVAHREVDLEEEEGLNVKVLVGMMTENRSGLDISCLVRLPLSIFSRACKSRVCSFALPLVIAIA